MNAETKQIRDVLGDQLSDLEDSLGATVDDVEMLAGLQQGIGRLLADNGNVEGEIRQVLQEYFDRGALRKETYQLVKSMLDRYVTEDQPTIPGDIVYDTVKPPTLKEPESPADAPAQDQFSSTAVLANDSFKPINADDQVQVGSVLRDRFLLQKRVSGGSMGVVYKALDRRLAEAGTEDPYVAIKVLSPQLARSGSALRALQQEAAKGRCLVHPNIVRFVDLDRDDELYFIVLEWLEGRTLADILDSADGKDIDLEQALNIVRQVGSALDYAHRCGIVHADIKPGNIMLTANGDVKLFDFGVARVRQAHGQQGSGDSGVFVAMTPAYSSMQVLTGDEPVPSDDVFSLGCLWYRLVAGYRVFGPRNAAEAAEEGMTPQTLDVMPPHHWAALKKAISYPRVTRFETMSEFLQELDHPADDLMSIEADDGFVAHETGGSKFWLIGLIVMLLLLGFAGYQFGLSDKVRDWLAQQDFGAWFEQADTGDVDAGAPKSELTTAPAEEITGDTDAEDNLDLPAENIVADEPVFDEEREPEAATSVLDYSSLPAADVDITLIESANDSIPIAVTLRENGQPVTVDLLRTGSLDVPLRLRIEEVSYSGNRSPWAAGQYTISDDDIIEIPAGQDRARVTLSMASDPLREADQQSTLRIRQAESTRTQLAAIEVVLQDDDQRAFEAGLSANTVAFAVSQVAVHERDPAVQIDVLRFNPNDQPLVVGYAVRDITATDGEDYFSPGGFSLSFGPRQRSARLLIPLVQDSLVEGDEAFTVELATQDESVPTDVFQRIIIMIRDDEIAGQ